MSARRRRQTGEGGISAYRVHREDGGKRVVLERGFLTRKDATAALRAEVRKADMEECVEPSRQRLDAYLEV